MTDTANLIPIGRFSSLTRISVRMLRHYDTHGVLVPADVDEQTGYRSYTADQLADTMLIRQLRDVGFGVSAIGALMASRDTSTFDEALAQQRAVLVDEARAATHRLTLIDTMREARQKESTMSITIDEQPFAARRIVGLRGTIPTYQDENKLWDAFIPQIAEQGIIPTGVGGSINHDDGYRESDVDNEVWFEVASGTTAKAPLQAQDLPEFRAARAVLTGPYDQIGEACDRLVRYAGEKNLSVAPGGMRYVYMNDPRTTPPEELVTEIYLPLA